MSDKQEAVAQWQTKLREPILPESDTWINVSEEGARKTMEKWSHIYEVRALVVAPLAQSAEQDRIDAEKYEFDVRTVVKDLIECLMLWNGQASAGLDVNALAGLRNELNAAIAKGASK